MPNIPFFRIFLSLLLSLGIQASHAENVLVAVAANFSKPMAEIAAEFTKATGHTAQLSFGSSGKFVSQVENGGPFEVFLSADEKGPKKLETAGLAVTSTHFTYALGRLVLWSAKTGYVDDQGKILDG
jgi:molybdate transport system substrate-binding protein